MKKKKELTKEMWKDAILEAERSVLPFRIKLQEIYKELDFYNYMSDKDRIIYNMMEDIFSKYYFFKIDCKDEDKDKSTELIKKTWFKRFIKYIIEAKYYGYNLILLGDIIEGEFPLISIIDRKIIDIKQEHVSIAPYMTSGISWNEPPYNAYHIWVPTKNPSKLIKSCSLGMLYNNNPFGNSLQEIDTLSLINETLITLCESLKFYNLFNQNISIKLFKKETPSVETPRV